MLSACVEVRGIRGGRHVDTYFVIPNNCFSDVPEQVLGQAHEGERGDVPVVDEEYAEVRAPCIIQAAAGAMKISHFVLYVRVRLAVRAYPILRRAVPKLMKVGIQATWDVCSTSAISSASAKNMTALS